MATSGPGGRYAWTNGPGLLPVQPSALLSSLFRQAPAWPSLLQARASPHAQVRAAAIPRVTTKYLPISNSRGGLAVSMHVAAVAHALWRPSALIMI